MKPRFQIIRGLPGSGKSTLAKTNWPHLLCCESDFFCMRGGAYSFGEARAAEGVRWFTRIVFDALGYGIDLVATGVFADRHEDLGLLVGKALDCGYEVWIETLTENYGNTHSVRAKDYEAMRASFASLDDLHRAFGETVHYGRMPTAFAIAPLPDGR